MATPFPFVSGAVLTAAQLNSITELVINDKTASYTLVAGDAGEYVVMNSASATTITVNNSIFSASQVIYIVNKGTANTTVTAGAGVTISTSASLIVPPNGSGRLLALSASAFIYEANGGIRSKVITATKTLSDATGNTTYTGVGFQPSVIWASGAISGGGAAAFGFGDSSGTASEINGTSGWSRNTGLLLFEPTTNNFQTASISSYNSDGFVLTWTKTGSPTGTANLIFLCMA